MKCLRSLLMSGLLSLYPPVASSDAIVQSQAMFADTIAEFFIEEDGVRVALEIGAKELGNFRNLLPDPVYESLDYGERLFSERLPEFFARDLVVAAGDEPLAGELRSIGPRARIVRDEITGEELPVAEEDAETVVAAELFYPFPDGEPETLVLKPPTQFGTANVGFVAYHNTVAVNDFRFLGPGMALDLDWADSWYSAFRTKNLRRSYFAPMSGFLYVETFEVRKEIIVRPKDMQRWVDLGLAEAEVIAAEQRGSILERIADYLKDRQPVAINGEAVEPLLDRANFLNRTLKNSMVVEPGIDINIDSAVVGVIFVYPTPRLADSATMTWDMFDERVQLVPASAVDEAGPLPTFLEPDFAVLEWQNFLKNPTDPGLISLSPPPSPVSLWLHRLRWWALGLGLVALAFWARNRRGSLAVATATAAALAACAFILGRPLASPDDATRQVVTDLLRNVYKAFDYRAESDIYDTLDRSVEGDLLTDIYLETQRSLELANQGGARAKVRAIEMQALEILPAAEPGAFLARATWNVNGSVGHWGHVHVRTNQYQAELTVRAIEDRWKLTGMNVLQELRL